MTPEGPVAYRLAWKRVKNLNLRLDCRGGVFLSVPMGCSPVRADAFVAEKSGWIFRRLSQRPEPPALPPEPDRSACVKLLREAVERVYPLVAGAAPFPQIKLRKMRSQWGNCHYRQGYITLNTALARCPAFLRDYVALHELVHFLHPDHGPGFYAAMDKRMPDWRQRRQALKRYAQALAQ